MKISGALCATSGLSTAKAKEVDFVASSASLPCKWRTRNGDSPGTSSYHEASPAVPASSENSCASSPKSSSELVDVDARDAPRIPEIVMVNPSAAVNEVSDVNVTLITFRASENGLLCAIIFVVKVWALALWTLASVAIARIMPFILIFLISRFLFGGCARDEHNRFHVEIFFLMPRQIGGGDPSVDDGSDSATDDDDDDEDDVPVMSDEEEVDEWWADDF